MSLSDFRADALLGFTRGRADMRRVDHLLEGEQFMSLARLLCVDIQRRPGHLTRAEIERDATAVVSTMQERIAEGRKAIPDLDTVVEEASDLPNGRAPPAIATSDNPAGVIYYLATHPETAQKLANLNEVQAAREVGRIEASISAPQQVSNAPRPGKPVGSRGAPSDGFRDDMTMDEFVKWRKAK